MKLKTQERCCSEGIREDCECYKQALADVEKLIPCYKCKSHKACYLYKRWKQSIKELK